MAPEMAQGQTVDYRADVYELGIVLFQMLSGHVPFTGNTPYAVMIRHVQEPLQLLHQINPAIPPAVDVVIQKAAAKQPGDRYQTAREMAQALRNATSTTIVSRKDDDEHISIMLSPSYPPGLPVATPQYETPLAQQQLSDARSSNPQWSNVGPPPRADTPVCVPPSYPAYQTPAHMPPTMQMRRQPLVLFFIAILLVIALVIGGVFVGIQISRGTQSVNPTSTGNSTTQPSATVPLQATMFPTPMATTAPTDGYDPPSLSIPLGTQIYQAVSPGPNCDKGGGQWVLYNGAQVSCLGNKTRVTNASQAGELDGIFLTRLPGQNYPANYVVQAQFQQDTTSSSDFGIYFRNQPGGQQRGVYSFLIHADGSWSAYVYDNTTGSETEISKGSTIGDAHAAVTLTVVVSGSQFSFYANGRAVGSVSDQTYASGTVGVAVDRGGCVVVSNFALYMTADGY
jgi:hypothetical protein